jgi:hypothetical protein
MKCSEKDAKIKLEKDANIKFDYAITFYDEAEKKHWFKIKMPSKSNTVQFRKLNKIIKGSTDFFVSEPEDFEPYKTLAIHLQKRFFDVFKYTFYDYGIDWELGTGQEKNLYCWTGKGWLEVAEIQKEFLSKFGKHRKNQLLKKEK